jgi:hypothetical protein
VPPSLPDRADEVGGRLWDFSDLTRCPTRVRNAHQSGHRPTPVVDRLLLRFAAVAFSAVVSVMPGFLLFNAATGLVELVSIGPTAPAALLTRIATNGATHF